MAKKKRAISTYLVTTYESIDAVVMGVSAGSHKLLGIFPVANFDPGRDGYGITVLHSAMFQMGDVEENEMLQAMTEEDRNLPQNQVHA